MSSCESGERRKKMRPVKPKRITGPNDDEKEDDNGWGT